MDQNLARDNAAVELNLPAQLSSLALLEACITALLGQVPQLNDREARTFEVILAAHETCTNIIEHAYHGLPGRIQVTFSFMEQPRRLAIELRDTGTSFDLSQVQPPNLNEAQTGGYGLFLIHRLMDEVVYIPGQSDNRWRLVKQLE